MEDDKVGTADGGADRHVDALTDSSHSLPLFPFSLPPSDTSPSRHSPYSPPVSPSPTVLVSLHMIEPSQTVSGSLSLHEYRKYLSGPQLDVSAPQTPRRTLKRKAKALNLNGTRSAGVPPSPPPSPTTSHPPNCPLSPQFSQSLDLSPSGEDVLGLSAFSLDLPNLTAPSADEHLVLLPEAPPSRPQRSVTGPALATTRRSPHGKRLVSPFLY